MPAPLPVCDHSEIAIAQECPGTVGVSDMSWVMFADELYNARSSVFSQGLTAAIVRVHSLLNLATTPFSQTFSCLPALIAAYFSLARLLALSERHRRALAFLQLGFIFVRDRGFSECTPWPVQGWDMMVAGRTLTTRMRALEDESVLSEVPPSYREPGLRIAIITICAYAEDAPVRQLCSENRGLYSAGHGYDVHLFTSPSEITPNIMAGMDVSDGVHKPFFWKVNAVKNVLDTGRYDWVLWMDCDAFFMDPLRTIDSLVAMYAYNTTASARVSTPRDDAIQLLHEHLSTGDASVDISLIIAVDSTGINNGVWMMRNTAWSHKFLETWWHSDILSGPGKQHNCSDQSTMVHVLLHERAMDLDDTWDAIQAPIWPLEVRVAAQEHMQSFHQATAESVMSRAWQEGDFIKHHPGCHYYLAPCQYLYEEAEEMFRKKVLALSAATHSS